MTIPTGIATMTPLGQGNISPYYVQSTYTPVFTAPGGTPPTFTSVVAEATLIGRLCYCIIDADNFVAGTPGAGAVQLFVTLPYPSTFNSTQHGIFPIGTAINGVLIETLYGRLVLPQTLALYRLAAALGLPRLEIFQAVFLNDANVRNVDASFVYTI